MTNSKDKNAQYWLNKLINPKKSWLYRSQKKKIATWAVVVAHLVERSLPTPDIFSLVIISCITSELKRRKQKREAGNGAFKKEKRTFWALANRFYPISKGDDHHVTFLNKPTAFRLAQQYLLFHRSIVIFKYCFNPGLFLLILANIDI